MTGRFREDDLAICKRFARKSSRSSKCLVKKTLGLGYQLFLQNGGTLLPGGSLCRERESRDLLQVLLESRMACSDGVLKSDPLLPLGESSLAQALLLAPRERRIRETAQRVGNGSSRTSVEGFPAQVCPDPRA
jgi:hypothetical protein